MRIHISSRSRWEPIDSFNTNEVIQEFWARTKDSRDVFKIEEFRLGETFLPKGPPRTSHLHARYMLLKQVQLANLRKRILVHKPKPQYKVLSHRHHPRLRLRLPPHAIVRFHWTFPIFLLERSVAGAPWTPPRSNRLKRSLAVRHLNPPVPASRQEILLARRNRNQSRSRRAGKPAKSPQNSYPTQMRKQEKP